MAGLGAMAGLPPPPLADPPNLISQPTLPCNDKTFTITIQKSSEIMLTFALMERVCVSGEEPERSRPKSHVSGAER